MHCHVHHSMAMQLNVQQHTVLTAWGINKPLEHVSSWAADRHVHMDSAGT